MSNSSFAPTNPITLMYRMYKYVLPAISKEKTRILALIDTIPNEDLREQARESFTKKYFHLQGGAVYVAAAMPYMEHLVQAIVSLQIISDYLDNVCETSLTIDEQEFRLLHQSMVDAVTVDAPVVDYYALHHRKNDGGYLQHLVSSCQQAIAKLPSYSLVQQYAVELAGYFNDLQVYKQLELPHREPKLQAFWEQHREQLSHLQWNEFAAATGSTIGIFALFVAATNVNLTEADATQVRNRYFPHICGLHIMLDYFIDQAEDRITGDLNFCNYYSDSEHFMQRMNKLVDWAREDATLLPDKKFHRMIVEGLLALYLSDHKIQMQRDVKAITQRLMKGSPLTRIFFFVNSHYIRRKFR